MQTALHILALVQELGREIVGGTVVSTEFYKKERAAYLFVKTKKSRLAFGFVYHPHGAGVFCVPASKVKIETREKPWPIFDLEKAEVTGVEQFGLDRIFRINILHKGAPHAVVCEAIGANGNLWFVDGDGGRRATLRKRDFTAGELYQPLPPIDALDPFVIEPAALEQIRAADPEAPPVALLHKNLLGFNRTLAIEVVHRSHIDQLDTPEELSAAVQTIGDLARRFRDADNGYLHKAGGRLEAYPFKLASAHEPPERFKTLSLAVMQMCQQRQSQVEEADEQKTVMQAVGRAVKRLERRLKNIEKDIEGAADYERYKQYGDLLKINFDALRKGMEEITVEDVYHGGGATVTIPLDPSLSPAENAENYFKKHRKGREGLELLKRRAEITAQELEGLRDMAAELDASFDHAREKYRSEISSLLPKEGTKEEGAPRLPYREYVLSTGLTVFVGRDGSDNDRTTFEFARPYETWLHAQQCPGSHVVMKYPNKSFEPSKQEVAEAAAIAAWFSKARNDSLVPVVYTQRRYVRKPRKAKPGLVTVEREKSVMVTPQAPE